tara:strand:- start:4840 stop:5394 length:555 start_codon:yes stop_codon:yes gene_type:complete
MNNKTVILCSLVAALVMSAPAFAQEQKQDKSPAFELSSLGLKPKDTNRDHIFDLLSAKVTIKTLCTGQYMLRAALESTDGQTIISTSPAFEYASPIQDPSLSFTAKPENQPHSIKVNFSGEQIRRAGINGPYVLKLQNIGRLECADTIDPHQDVRITGNEFKAQNFGENCGMGEDARPCKDVYK